MCGTLSVCFLILYCCSSVFASDAEELAPIVETKYGKVKGTYTDQARVFKSIPYGGSVSGDNRWMEAQPHEAWYDLLDATSDPPACPQNPDPNYPEMYPEEQDEDCLFLNVFTPLSDYLNPNSNLPVLVYIHGGGYILGYSAYPMYDGSYLASHSNIIVVTINYRLGALGFLVYGATIKGNFGIKDQLLALEWVQDNIAYFGGDPNQVTISGQSAGAMSVAIHMTSNMQTSGLFHKAIIQSDPFGIGYRTARVERQHGNDFALELGCSNKECLHNKDLSEILEKQNTPYMAEDTNVWKMFLTWAPVIDGDEIIDQPLERFEEGCFTKVPTIMGTTSAEGIIFIHALFKDPIKKPFWYSLYLAVMFGFDNVEEAEELYPSVPYKDHRPQLSEGMTDYIYYCPTILSAVFAERKPVYSYIFNHRGVGSSSTTECHGAEQSYVFHTYDELRTPEENELADVVSGYWGNFVSTGNPNTPPGHKNTVESCEADGCTGPELPEGWPRFTSATNQKSLIMELPKFRVEEKYREDYCTVLNTFGYAYDVFVRLRQSADFTNTLADSKKFNI